MPAQSGGYSVAIIRKRTCTFALTGALRCNRTRVVAKRCIFGQPKRHDHDDTAVDPGVARQPDTAVTRRIYFKDFLVPGCREPFSLRQGRLDGINPSPRIRHLLAALDAACNVPADIPDPRAWSGDPQSGMTSAQAAAALGVSERHARRLAPSLNAHRRGHRLLFDQATVREYAREKAC